MSLQITNPVVVDKVGRIARTTGSSKTAAVEPAVAKLPRAMEGSREATARFAVVGLARYASGFLETIT